MPPRPAPLSLRLRSAALCHSQLLWLRPGPSLGSLGARLLNWFQQQQQQEPELQASNLSLDYGTLTPLSLEASAGPLKLLGAFPSSRHLKAE